MEKINFYITFNRDKYKTEENKLILESIKGVEKDEWNNYFITADLTTLGYFCRQIEKKTNYKASVIITFDSPELFLEFFEEI